MTKRTATIISGLAIAFMFVFSSTINAATIKNWNQWRGNGRVNARLKARNYVQRDINVERAFRLNEGREISFRLNRGVDYGFDKLVSSNYFQKELSANRDRDLFVSRFKDYGLAARFEKDFGDRFNRFIA